MSDSRDFQSGSVIANHYKVVKYLGGGAFGDVYLVEDLHLAGELFALKVLKMGGAEGDEKRRQRFLGEARVLLKLVHPSIVMIRNFLQFERLVCYTMDFVEGKELKELLEEGGPLEVERALLRTREVLAALAVAHDKGVVHRDIKPENVLVTEIGTDREVAKVLDFGIAKLINQESLGLTGGGAIGTPAYMSPEQGLGQKGTIDARSDIYSVGCLLYELLTGLTPFESESLLGFFVQHGTQPVPPMAE
ncbi:MAG: serine/threonine-protein kinase, partial [Planctomycetota bacterium]